MKKFLILTSFIFLISGQSFSFDFKKDNLYPINDKNGGGYINKDGSILIEQKYNFAYAFVDNFAIVQAKNNKYGIIDRNGNVVIDFQYDELTNLSENFVFYKEDNKFGCIDILNKSKSKAIYDKTKKFKEGLAAVLVDDKWGFINKKGEIVIKPQYFAVSNFSEGLAAVSHSAYKTSGYINKKGKTVILFKDNSLEPKEFYKGLAPVITENDKACSYINKRGKTVLDNKKIYPANIYCGNFYEGLSVFYIDNNPRKITTGYIDKKGKIKYSMLFPIPKTVSEGEFSAFEHFSSNMAQFTTDYKTGYINRKFQIVIPPVYEFARDFTGDLAYVKFENKEGYINKKGQWIWQKEREGM